MRNRIIIKLNFAITHGRPMAFIS